MSSQPQTTLSPKTYPLGDAALVLQFGETIDTEILQAIRNWTTSLQRNPFPGMIELVPAYTTLTIYYNPWLLSEGGKYDAYERALSYIHQNFNFTDSSAEKAPVIEIPVCYGGEFGPDLEYVANHNQLAPEEVISIHSESNYLVYMIGFAPGFPYLGGMDKRISAPRKANPRMSIPQGSVGIAGAQTGIYPIETPGGWQLIGRTPLLLFNPKADSPALLQAGDRIRFVPISKEEYHLQKESQDGT